MKPEPESVIVCEGYHDRAFWDGWLRFMDCVEKRKDNRGISVGGGDYGFKSPAEEFIRVVPCHGKDGVKTWTGLRLQNRGIKPVRTLIVNADRDDGADGSAASKGAVNEAAVEGLVKALEAPCKAPKSAEYVIDNDDGTQTRVLYLPWWTPDPNVPGLLPNLQTLERLVCAALTEVYPKRAEAVAEWLKARPEPPDPDPKDHAWSHMAGWYASLGCEAFLKCLWDKDEVAEALRRRLEEIGAWKKVHELCRGPQP